MIGAATRRTGKFKAGQKVLCRILNKEADGYSVSVREMHGKSAGHSESGEDWLVEGFPGYFPTTISYEVGDLITAMFVCVHGGRFLVSTRYMRQS
jgi:hypothetical protein